MAMSDKRITREKVRARFIENKNIRILLFTLILLSEIITLLNNNFLSSYNLVSIGQSAAPYIVLSLGAVFAIALGYTDLSAGAVCIASAVIAGKLLAVGLPLWAAIPVMLLNGAVIGFANGMLISKLALPPFIVTLGSMMFVRGTSALFANEPFVLFPTDSWYNRVFSSYHSIPTGLIWAILLDILTGWFFRKSKYGRHILAVGSCEKAALIAGLDTAKLKVTAFTLSGLMAGAAAILWSASFATVTVATGNGMELDAIAGAYIGGCAAAGGSVNALGTMVGALLLVVIRNGLNFILARMNISLNATYVTYTITGIIVILAVFLDKSKERAKKPDADEQEKNPLKMYLLPAAAFILAVIMVVTNIGIYVKKKNEKNNTIAVLMKTENNGFWNAIRAGAEDAAGDHGYRLLVRGPESEDSSQLPLQRELMSIMLSENPAAMAVATIADGFTDLLDEAYDRNVPLVQYDSGLFVNDLETVKHSDRNPLAGFVQGSSYDNAALLAEAVFDNLKDKIAMSESYVIGVIQHNNSVSAGERTSGFREKMMELAEADPDTAGKLTIYVEVKPSDANNAYKDGLEALYEKGASMIYMTAEVVANQVYDSIAAAGGKYDGMCFAGFDSGNKVHEWIMSDSKSKFICGVSQNPYLIGYLTAESLIKAGSGEKIEELTVVPGTIYTKENYEELLEKQIVN